MNATDLLRDQHRDVEQSFVRVESALDDREKRTACEQLLDTVAAHSTIEKEIFYAALLDEPDAGPDVVDRLRCALEEHALVDFGCLRLAEADPGDPVFMARVQVIKEMIEHHVQEEESDLLPRAESLLGEERLEDLGAEMEARFGECLETGHAKLLAEALGLTRRARRPAKKAARRAGTRAGTKTKAPRPKRTRATKGTQARGRGTARNGRKSRAGRGSSGSRSKSARSR